MDEARLSEIEASADEATRSWVTDRWAPLALLELVAEIRRLRRADLDRHHAMALAGLYDG